MKTILILLFPLLLQAQIGPENDMMDMEQGMDMITWIKSISKSKIKSNPMPESFDLEKYYQLFLEKINLKESEMPIEQSREMKRAFMGGAGIILLIVRDELPKLSTIDAEYFFNMLFTQVQEFWINQVAQQN